MEQQRSAEELISDRVNAAINCNNLSVVELRSKNYPAALQAARQALSHIEKTLLEQTQQFAANILQANQAFLENLHVLLVSYYNLGMCQLQIAQAKQEPAGHATLSRADSDPVQEARKVF